MIAAPSAVRPARSFPALLSVAALCAVLVFALPSAAHATLEFHEVQQVPAQHWDFTASQDCGLASDGTLWITTGTHAEAFDISGHLVDASDKFGGLMQFRGGHLWTQNGSAIQERDASMTVLHSVTATRSTGAAVPIEDFDVGCDKSVYVAEGTSDTVGVFDDSGALVRELPVASPLGVAVDSGNHVFAVSNLSTGTVVDYRIAQFAEDGSAVTSFTCADSYGTVQPARSILPRDDGTLLVTVPGAIWRFSRSGVWLGTFATDPIAPALNAGRLHPGPGGTYCWTEAAKKAVTLLGSDGHVIRTVGARVSRVDWFDGPTSLAFDKQGNGYLADTTSALSKFSATGEFLRNIALVQLPAGSPVNPRRTGVAVDASGYIYSADPDLYIQSISRFSPDGEYVSRLYGLGTTPYTAGNGIAFAPDGRLYATANMKLLRFDPQFNLEWSWRSVWPELTNYGFDQPLAVSPRGELLVGQQVTPQTPARVLRYSFAGAPKGAISMSVDNTRTAEKISAIAAASDGTIFVADANHGYVQYFSPEGAYTGKLSPSWLRPFTKPQALAFDPAGRLWVADDNELRCFEVKGLIPPPVPAPVAVNLDKPALSVYSPRRRTRVTFTTKMTPTSAATTLTPVLSVSHRVVKTVRKRVNGRTVRSRVVTWPIWCRVKMTGAARGRFSATLKLGGAGLWRAWASSPGRSGYLATNSVLRTFTVK